MAKRILALVLAAFTFAAALSGCDEEEAKATDSTADGTHVHAIADGDKYDTDDTNHYYTCATCGEYVTEKHEDELFYNVNGHYTSCKCHYSSGELISHTLENGKCTCGYTEDKDHTHSYTQCLNVADDHHLLFCDCGKEVKEDHSMSEWTYEEGYVGHISTCKCGEIKTEGHKIDENNKCTVCGYQGHVCTFPDVPETFDDEMHYYECLDENCNLFSGATHYYDTEYSHDADSHYNICLYCDHKGNREEHSYFNGTFITDCLCGVKAQDSTGLEFEENGDGYTLIGMGSCTDKLVIVPETYNGKPVTSIGSSAFEGNTDIVSVKLPDSVKSIGSSAFAGCTSLKSVNIPDGVTVIRDNTFAVCTSLIVIYVPDTLRTVEMFAFSGCTSLLGFSNGTDSDSINTEMFKELTYIDDSAFANCKSLEGELIFFDYEYIGNLAFSGCTSIKSITIVNVTTLGGDAFSGCTSLTTVAIEPDALNMNDGWGFDIGTFSGCTSLKKLMMADSFENSVEFFANSTIDEEMGLSWYEGCPDFTVEFSKMVDGEWVDDRSMKISEIYDYVNENYWQ